MRLLYLTDLDIRGSGYMNLSLPILDNLARRGHDVKVLGLGNKGEQHSFPFSIFPCVTLKESFDIAQNLYQVWPFDFFIVALDIPVQVQIIKSMLNRSFKYVGIMPVEADPLLFEWGAHMMQMDKCFVISEFGTQEAIKAGVQAEHLHIGIDANAWRMPTEEEKKNLRQYNGLKEDEFVILTVADNQERKNLDACFRAIKKAIEKVPNLKYLLVTRWENEPVGWHLDSLAFSYGIHDHIMRFDRGMSFAELWGLYASSDAFMLLSKAEGLGMPLLEAMATGVPCIGTDCTSVHELLDDNRGYLIDTIPLPDDPYVDPFGNGHRYFADYRHAAKYISYLADMKKLGEYGVGVQEVVDNARKYVEDRTWEKCVDQIERYINEQEKSEE